MGEWINDVGKSLSLSRRSLAGKHRPPRPAGKGTGDESSVSSLSEQSRKSPRSRSSHSSRLSQMSELKRMMAEITAMQKKMHELHNSREPPKTPSPTKPKASTGMRTRHQAPPWQNLLREWQGSARAEVPPPHDLLRQPLCARHGLALLPREHMDAARGEPGCLRQGSL